MKTYLDCIPCFFKQARDAAILAGANKSTQKKILTALGREILNFKLDLSPVEMGRILYKLVRETTGENDPFKEIKQKSNQSALALYPDLKNKVKNSKDKLLTAIELAIAGNIIDYGVKNSFSSPAELEEIFVQEDRIIRRENKKLFEYSAFKKALGKVKKVLYLGDNAGEVVFDRVLIEELNKEVIYAVRGKPIINDALFEDALRCGIDKCARVISTGCDAPGIVLDLCSNKFRKIFNEAEFIISKGQGNFEALADKRRPIFFLFKAKCSVVAKYLGCNPGDIILKKAD